MTTTSGEKPLELSVRNFGPIAEADIELRPLTVFVGPSNTGKSYLATLIYALHQFFGSYGARHVGRSRSDTGYVSTAQLPPRELFSSTNDMADLLDWAIAFGSNIKNNEEAGAHPYPVPEAIVTLIRSAIDDPVYHVNKLDGEITRVLGVVSIDSLVNRATGGDKRLSISLNKSATPQQSGSIRYDVAVSEGHGKITSVVPSVLTPTVGKALTQWSPLFSVTSDEGYDPREISARALLATIVSEVAADMGGPLVELAHYLPADRAGAVRSHPALTGALISRASRPVLASQQTPFSGIYGDFLEGVVGLGGLPTKTAGTFDTLSDSMELNILDGEIWVDSNLAGYPSFFYRPKGWDQDIPLMNASSMVSELAPVVLYLRHVVQPGETLIIEEPESALHPAMQVELTRLLAAAVKAGIRIIITTHSEWILEELANLVLMSELPVEQRHGFEGADLVLNPDDVGAWLFEPDAEIGGTVIKEIPLDKEMGNFDSGFGLITTDLYNRYARISNRIERLKEG